MVGDVLARCRECAAIERRSSSQRAFGGGRRPLHGAIVVEDTAESGQSAAVSLGIATRLDRGSSSGPCAFPVTVQPLGPRRAGGPVGRRTPMRSSIVPDRHGSGTNGLLLTPPDVMTPSFGPDSRARHERLARTRMQAGASSSRPRCCSTSTPARTWTSCASVWPASTSGTDARGATRADRIRERCRAETTIWQPEL